MLFLFAPFAGLLIYLSYRSLLGGIEYLKFFRKESARPPSGFTPFASVIVPCKGIDSGLEVNLTAIVEQDYPEYEIVFVIDGESDPSAMLIGDLISRKDAKVQSRVVIAPKAADTGQKVENLRAAVLCLDPRSEVIVFVDSDARPTPDLLRSLIARLDDANVGVSTGYRWFISERPTLSSELRNIWNASIASQLGPGTNDNFCWGGAMAIRRDVFHQLEIREKWKGTVSDDFTVMRAVRAAGLEIVFVPQALTPSVGNCTFRELVEFTTRQMQITRVYAPRYWLLSLFGSGFYCVTMVWALLLVLFSRSNNMAVWTALTTVAAITVLSVAKSWLRLKAAMLVLPGHRHELRRQFFPQITLWSVTPFLFLYNSIFALVSRRIRWRGITYELISPTDTRVIKPAD